MGKFLSRSRYTKSGGKNTAQADGRGMHPGALGYSNLNKKHEPQDVKWQGMLHVLQNHIGPINTLTTLSPNICISGGKDNFIIVQNIDVGHVEQKWTEHIKEITKVRAVGCLVASSSRDLTVKIWNITKTDSLTTLKGHQLVITGVDFNSDCSRICSGSRDNSVRIWDIETSTCLDNSKLSRNLVTDIQWLENEHILVQTSEDKMLKLWDTRNLEIAHSFPPQNQIQTCCDVCGYYCITGNNGFQGQGCQITLWDLRQRMQVQEYRGHKETVSGCTFIQSSTSSRTFTTCSNDGTVCLWQENKSIPNSREQLDVGPLTSIATLHKDTVLCGSFNEGIRAIRRSLSDKLVPCN